MGEAYHIRDQEMPYFLTFQVVGWADVFSRKVYRDFPVTDGYTRPLSSIMNEPPKKIKTRGIDPMIYLDATEFYETAELIQEENKTRALIVNYAFSIELYIKCLFVTTEFNLIDKPGYPEYKRSISTIRDNKHDLLELFKKLPDADQSEIAKLYSHKYKSEISEHLDEIKGDFIKWRYAYEKDQLVSSTGALKQISRILKVRCMKENIEDNN
ncbi:hypothetical protein [Echinicola salinicaeni]|uniref:hypothetical protein n=1 Tax=Echinicola salinicaeni TaxID=2762757 RepID=UPI001647B510|nr:hypothetical protein [Echinicola salinicaeni]